jgi:hypothetical protein
MVSSQLESTSNKILPETVLQQLSTSFNVNMSQRNCFKCSSYLLNFYGVHFFPGLVFSQRTIRICGYLQVFMIALSVSFNIYRMVILHQKEAIAAVLANNIVLVLMTYKTRKVAGSHQMVLSHAFELLSVRYRTKLSGGDTKIVMLQLSQTIFFIVGLCAYISFHVEESRDQLLKTFPFIQSNDSNFVIVLKMLLLDTIQNIFYYGQVYSGWNILNVNSCTFSFFSRRLLRDLKKMSKEKNEYVWLQRIVLFRIRLRHYWQLKAQSDDNINLLPLLWLFFGLFSCVSFFTRVLVDWDQLRKQAIIMLMTVIIVISCCITIFVSLWMTDRTDRYYDEVIAKALLVSEQGKIRFSENNVNESIGLQLSLFDYEIKNRPDVRHTIWGIMILDRSLLISYLASAINFFVMVLTIRISVKQQL